MRFKMKLNSIKRLLPLYSSILLTIFISVVSPGGKFVNNLMVIECVIKFTGFYY